MAMKRVKFTALPDESGPVSPDRLDELQDNVDEAKIDRTPSTSFSENLNDIKTTSFIYASGGTINIPRTGYSFYITTIALNNNYIYQEAKRAANSMAGMETFERQCFNGTWTEWKQTNIPIITTGTEVKTGRVIDGKEEYVKRLDIGNLPNATAKNVNHGLSNVKIERLEGVATNNGLQALPLPFASEQGASSSIRLQSWGSYVSVYTGTDRSAFTGVVDIYYTKN